MYSNTFGWDLPPSVTQQMIDEQYEGGDDDTPDDDDPREDPHYDY